MMGLEFWITLPISKIAWLDSLLNIMCSFANHSFVLQECMCADFFVTDMSIRIVVRSCMLQFPVG